MNLVIASSNTIAFSISRTLNCTDRTPDGAFTNDTGSIVVTAVDPGLFAPVPLQYYTDGSDFVKTLPFIPEKHYYGVRRTMVDGKLKVSPEDKMAANNLLAHVANADEVIFASDGGGEAQALFALLCAKTKVGVKTGRMWLTSLNHKAVSNAYRHRHNGRHVTRIARAGLLQLGMDFLHNTNVEQAFAQAYGKGAFALGRPDTALLWTINNMIESRKKAVEGTPKQTVGLTCTYKGQAFILAPTEVWSNREIAEAHYYFLQEEVGTPIHATIIDVEDKIERPEPCYTLATLQVDAISQLGMLPGKVETVATALFEKGYISSHRTSTPNLPERLRRQLERRYPTAKQFDFIPDAHIPYCHGIIVTERTPMFLSHDEERLYTLIKERMETALDTPIRYTEVAVEMEAGGLKLYGSIELPYGSRPEDDIILVTATGASILGFSAKKPGPLKADSFLEGIYEVMGINAPGRKLPLDGIHNMGLALQHLIDNGFVKELFGELEVTDKGRLLVKHTEELELSDLGTLMSQIQEVDDLAGSTVGTKGTMKAYEDWICSQIRPLVANTWLYANKPTEFKCPKCGATMTSFPAVVACDHCDFTVPKFFKGYELSETDIRQLLTYGYTSPIYGFIGNQGRKFCDALVLDAKFRVTFAAKATKIYS